MQRQCACQSSPATSNQGLKECRSQDLGSACFDSHAPHIIQSIHSVLVKFLATRQQVWSKMPRPSIPEDKINLRLILVSGKTKDYLFRPSDSAGEIAQYVFDNWPIDWNEEAVSSAEILRMIYQGRFLHGNVTLAALGLPTGKTTVMHLVPRESLPEPNSQDDESKKKGRTSGCCTCSILQDESSYSLSSAHSIINTNSHTVPINSRAVTERQNLQLFYGFRILLLLHYKKLFHFVSRQQRSNNCRKVKEDYGDTASTDTASKQPLKKQKLHNLHEIYDMDTHSQGGSPPRAFQGRGAS